MPPPIPKSNVPSVSFHFNLPGAVGNELSPVKKSTTDEVRYDEVINGDDNCSAEETPPTSNPPVISVLPITIFCEIVGNSFNIFILPPNDDDGTE